MDERESTSTGEQIPIQDCGKLLLLRWETLQHIHYRLKGRSQVLSERLKMRKETKTKDYD